MPLFYEACMKRLELTDFKPHIGTIFRFSAGSGAEAITTDLELTSVVPYELDPKDGRTTDTTGKYRSLPFSLFFEGRQEKFLAQSLYTVTHPAFAEPLEIFIVCLGPNNDGTGFLYEAAFA